MRLAQVAQVAHVQQVEDAIGQDDARAALTKSLEMKTKRYQIENDARQ